MPDSMTPADAAALRAALRGAGRLKDTLRSGFTQAGAQESVAEHSWRLCLMTLLLAPRLGVDPARALALAVVHDLGEALSGDTPAPLQAADPGKGARERADLAVLMAPAPADMRAAILALWEEYDAGATPEARLVKALDKLKTIMTHAEGANPPDFDYTFNLGYGRKATDAVSELAALRAILDAETAARAGGGGADG
jgi:putative hydrolase of HD superfamily